jgi:hypothetical protein
MHWSKRVWLFILIIFSGHIGFAQNAELDSIIHIINFKKDSIQSIFHWVINEVDYDPQQLLLVNRSTTYGSLNQNTIREAIRRKKGVCLHYAQLFNALLQRAGYESYVIQGYTRQDKSDDKYAHAWNAVKSNGQWFLYDPTWAAGYVTSFVYTREFNEEWYKVKPAKFIETHIPFDPIWQFLNPPFSRAANGSYTVSAIKESYSFQDSIRAFAKSTENQQAVASLGRVKKINNPNQLAQQYQRSLESYVKNVRDYTSLQNAHLLLSKAVGSYNDYIFSKNHQFKSPHWTDEMLTAFPIRLKTQTDSTSKLVNAVATGEVQIAQYQSQLKKQITDFYVIIDTENTFIRKYLATWKPMRMQHFYKK